MGVDSSTQSTKVEIRVLQTGELIAGASFPHPPTHPPRSEADPADWWLALVEACHRLGDRREAVVAISVAGQQHGLVVLDDRDRVMRPAKLWNDTESAPQAARLVDHLGPDVWASSCGSVPVASFTISKLAWLVEHEPDVAARTRRIMLPHDWLTFTLTGNHVTDRGDASGTGWFSASDNTYRADLLALVDNRDWLSYLPTVLGPLQAAGELRDEPARQLGLKAGIVVGPGTGDNMGAALGLGLQPGDVAISLGTSGTAFTVSRAPSYDPTGIVAGFADASGNHLPLVCTLNATKVTDTVGSWLGLSHTDLAELALQAPVGANGVLLIPYFDGERTPNRPGSTGLIHGIRTSTDRASMARAAHEGVICGLMDGVDALGAVGIDVSGRLVLTGGGARSVAYRDVTASLAARDVSVPATTEVVTAGACLQAAAVLTGTDPLDMIGRWRTSADVIVPWDGVDSGPVRERYSSVTEDGVRP